VRGGHGDLLLQLYDAEFARVDDFLEREVKDLYVGPPLVAALNGAGREAEANAIAQRLMARLDGSVREGVPAASVAHLRAQLFALTGRRDQALEQLALAVQRDWVNVAWIPTRLADRPPFQDLRGEPRLAVVQADLDRRVNAQRAALGLPPLKN
jgi:hypothetical protein